MKYSITKSEIKLKTRNLYLYRLNPLNFNNFPERPQPHLSHFPTDHQFGREFSRIHTEPDDYGDDDDICICIWNKLHLGLFQSETQILFTRVIIAAGAINYRCKFNGISSCGEPHTFWCNTCTSLVLFFDVCMQIGLWMRVGVINL